ncbi:MAG: hypothetical protein LBG06_03935 [Deltaproteobacteria bacterium]|jgi:hypothetical protein|nr:hypothetical protein [Deltaproteobacteria bacterium]
MASDTQINRRSCSGPIGVIPGEAKRECPWRGSEARLLKLKDGDGKLVAPSQQDENSPRTLAKRRAVQSGGAPCGILPAGTIGSAQLACAPSGQAKGPSEVDRTASSGFGRAEPCTGWGTAEREGGGTEPKQATRRRTVAFRRSASGRARADLTARVHAGTGIPSGTSGMPGRAPGNEPAVRHLPGRAAGRPAGSSTGPPEDVPGRMKYPMRGREYGEAHGHARGDRQRGRRRSSSRGLEPAGKRPLPLARAASPCGGGNYGMHADGESLSGARADPLPMESANREGNAARDRMIRRGWIPSVLAAAAAASALNGLVFAGILPAPGGPAAGSACARPRVLSVAGCSRRFRAAAVAQRIPGRPRRLGILPGEMAEEHGTLAVPPRVPPPARTGPDAISSRPSPPPSPARLP